MSNFHLTPQPWSFSQDLQCSLMEGGIGKVCLELTTEQSLFGPDVLGVCCHVFLEEDFHPHEWLSSQSLGENTTLAPGQVSRLVPDLCALYITQHPEAQHHLLHLWQSTSFMFCLQGFSVVVYSKHILSTWHIRSFWHCRLFSLHGIYTSPISFVPPTFTIQMVLLADELN